MKKNVWLSVLGTLVLFSMVLSACAPAAATPAAPQIVEVTKIVEGTAVIEQVIVTATPEPTVNPYDDTAPIKVMADTTRAPAIQLFLDANPQYKDLVEIMTDDRGVFITKLLLYNNVGGGWPDVIFHETNVLRLANTKQYDYYTTDLTPWIDKSVIDQFYPGANAPCMTPDGKLICLRNDIAPNVLYFNVPKFKEWGYAVPTNWEEFLALAVTVSKEHPGTFMLEVDSWVPELLYYVGSECPMMNPLSDTQFRVNFLHPNCERMSKMLDELNKLGVVDTTGTWAPGLGDRWKKDEWLTWIGPVWEADFVIKGMYLDPEKAENQGVVGMAPMLKWADQDQIWTGSAGGAAWAMSRHTKNPKLAAELIKFVTTDPSVTSTAVTLSAFKPGGDAWAKTLTDRNSLLAKETNPADVMIQMAAAIWPEYREGPPLVGTITGPIFTDIQAGKKTITEAAEEIQKGLVDLTEKAGYEVVITGP